MSHKTTPKIGIYKAELWVTARVIVEDEAAVRLVMGTEVLTVSLHPRLRPQLAALLAGQSGLPLACKLWPRTGPRARLRQEVCVLRAVSAEPVEPQLLVQGRVKSLGEPEGCLRVSVQPNRRGDLQQPFDLTLLAAPELLAQLERGQAVRVQGRLGEGRRLVAERAEGIRLPGRRPSAGSRRALRAKAAP